jgi:hypothetical protein
MKFLRRLSYLIATLAFLASSPGSAVAADDRTDCSHDLACLAQLVHGPTASPTAPSPSDREANIVTPGVASVPNDVQTMWLPKGVSFPVHTMQSYSGYEARDGSPIRLEVTQDVIVAGRLVAMSGDTAIGHFIVAQRGKISTFDNPDVGLVGVFGSRASLLQMTIDRVYSYCGDEIVTDFDRTEYRRKRFGFLFDADVDQHIIRGQEYVAFTYRPQRVCSTPTTASMGPIPATALYSTAR